MSDESGLSLRDRIGELLVEQREALGEALLEFDSLMDLTQWPDRAQPNDADAG